MATSACLLAQRIARRSPRGRLGGRSLAIGSDASSHPFCRVVWADTSVAVAGRRLPLQKDVPSYPTTQPFARRFFSSTALPYNDGTTKRHSTAQDKWQKGVNASISVLTRIIRATANRRLENQSLRNEDKARRFVSSDLDRSKINIFEMNSRRIAAVEDRQDLQDLVQQLEDLQTLTAEDIAPLVEPLTRQTATVDPELTERILFTCLRRLPPSPAEYNANLPFPTVIIYNRALMAWGETKTEEGAERAQAIFELMETEYLREKESLPDGQVPFSPAPCRTCYKSVIRAWAVSGSDHGPVKADEFLEKLEKLSGVSQILEDGTALTDAPLEFPDKAIYNMVMSAYSKAFVDKHPVALDRVRALAERMDRLLEVTGNDEYKLDNFSFHFLLRAYSRYVAFVSLEGGESLDPKYAPEIEALLQRMCESSNSSSKTGITQSWAYGVWIDALIKTQPTLESLEKAEAVALGLAQQPNGLHLPVTQATWPRHDSLVRLVKALKRTHIPQANQMVNRLLKLAAETPHDRIFFCHDGMEAWVKSGLEEAPFLVERMLDRALELNSTRSCATGQTFAIAIKAWLRCEKDDAPYRAELVFKKMLDAYESRGERFAPKEVHLRYVMSAWIGRCNQGRQYIGVGGTRYPAEHTENWVLSLWRSDWMQRKNLAGHFAMAIRAWSKQSLRIEPGDTSVVQRAVSLLNQYEEISGTLPAFCCNWVLQACCRHQAAPDRRLESYQTAINTFRRGKRNARSYELIIKALKVQMESLDDNHRTLVEEIFVDCCSAGLLTQDVVWRVADVVSSESLQRLFKVSHQYASAICRVRAKTLKEREQLQWDGKPPRALLVENLPPDWSRIGSRPRTESFEQQAGR